MIRKEIYQAVVERLRAQLGDDILHFDLWNHNVEFIEQETAWERPAVFIEFGEISWARLAGEPIVLCGEGTLRIHLVTDWLGDVEDDSRFQPFALSERIHRALFGLRGAHFHGFELLATHTNHNHEELLENVDVYQFMAERQL